MQSNDLIETSPKIPLNSIQYNNNEQIQANCDPSFIQTYEKLQTKSRNNLTFVKTKCYWLKNNGKIDCRINFTEDYSIYS